MTQELELMFDKLIEAKQYNLVEDYLEDVKPTFNKYDEYKSKVYVAKADDLTKRIVEEQGK